MDEDLYQGDSRADKVYRWMMRGLYLVLIGGNVVWFVSETETGKRVIARLKARAAECQGCAERKQKLRQAVAHMHWQARDALIDAESHEAEPEPRLGAEHASPDDLDTVTIEHHDTGNGQVIPTLAEQSDDYGLLDFGPPPE